MPRLVFNIFLEGTVAEQTSLSSQSKCPACMMQICPREIFSVCWGMGKDIQNTITHSRKSKLKECVPNGGLIKKAEN